MMVPRPLRDVLKLKPALNAVRAGLSGKRNVGGDIHVEE